MKAVYLKELKNSFCHISVYACYAFIFLIAGLYVWAINILSGSGEFGVAVSSMALWVFVLSAPLLTMRVFTEEKKQNTDKLLYSLPLKATDIVLGKFFSVATVLLVPVLVIGIYPLVLSMFGNVSLPTSFSTLFAFYLVGVAFVSAGIFISSVTENQVVAAVLTAALIFADYYLPYIASYASSSAVYSVIFLAVLGVILGVIAFFMTKNYIVGLLTAAIVDFGLLLTYFLKTELFEGFVPEMLLKVSLFDRLEAFSGGAFELTNIVFYLSVTVVFLFLTVQSVEKRRWS